MHGCTTEREELAASHCSPGPGWRTAGARCVGGYEGGIHETGQQNRLVACGDGSAHHRVVHMTRDTGIAGIHAAAAGCLGTCGLLGVAVC